MRSVPHHRTTAPCPRSDAIEREYPSSRVTALDDALFAFSAPPAAGTRGGYSEHAEIAMTLSAQILRIQ
ncbi:hypothetical protein [Sorangium sp. So ce388]|uniref:hypothetical protein n=1 Tax=Sorangium sp. So ce388 TaxID=3133309 RepID=UPI003F5BE0FD